MAKEATIAREGSVSGLNGVSNGGRSVPRLYDTSDNERYPITKSLGISTRDETAEKDRAVLESVIGQLSDGMWENSPAMEKYWRGMKLSQDERGNVELRHASSYDVRVDRWLGGRNGRMYSWREGKSSGFNGMGSKEVREFFAKKIKQIADRERKDYPSVGKWSATNNSPLDYFHSGVTVADAYSLYKRLKG